MGMLLPARALGGCEFVDFGELTRRYDRAVAGEVLAQVIRRRIPALTSDARPPRRAPSIPDYG
jgi:hypothetical protein